MPLTTIGTDAIDALAVTTAKLAADAVTAAKIATDAVDTAEIAASAVETAEILDANVTLAKIANQAANTVLVRDANSSGVVSAKALATTEILIGDGTGFTAAALSGDVTMANTGAVTIADSAVTLAKIADAAANTVLVRDANSSGVVSAKAVATTEILIGDGTGFTAAALSGDVTMTNAGAVTIASGAVENSMLANMAANTVKVRDANSSGAPSDKALATTEILIGDGTGFTAAALSGDVTMTNAGAITIATDAVDIAMLSATGTADATTFLRGDNSWAAAGGDNTPAFQAYLSGTITNFPDEAWTKVAINAEDFDADSVYDHATNYRFTVPAGEGGKYFLFASVSSENANNDGEKFQVGLYLNGARIYEDIDFDNTSDSYGWNSITGQVTAIVTLVATDYVEVYAYTRSQNGGGTPFIYAGTKNTKFLGYKMIGL